MRDSIVPVALGVLALLALVLAVALLRMRSRTRLELEEAHAETGRLRAQIDQIERRLATPAARQRAVEEYTITGLGTDLGTSLGRSADTEEPPTIDRALFADLVLRETVVRAASLAHGVRRALAPETRNRLRFEVRREIRRSRKKRKADLREARRDWESRQRAAMTDDEDAA
jgi:DNA gyrase/topoisomerase IV subunit A